MPSSARASAISFRQLLPEWNFPIVVDKEIVDGLAAEVENTQGAGRIGIDLQEQTITSSSGKSAQFLRSTRGGAPGCSEGLDEVSLTLQRDDEIRAFQASTARSGPDPFRKEIGMNNLSNMIKVAVVGGEGIGPEVTAQSHRILNWFAAKRGVPMIAARSAIRAYPYLATGKVPPPDTVEAMDEADAILGRDRRPRDQRGSAAARKAEACCRCAANTISCANLRPIVATPALADSAPQACQWLRGVDFIIIRELTSGIYFENCAASKRLPTGSVAVSTPSNTPPIKSAAWHGPLSNSARTRKGRYVRVDKANVLETSVLWREEVIALHAAEFSDVELQPSLCR